MRSIWDRIIKPIVQPIIDTIVKPIVDNIVKPIIDSILNPEPDNRGEKDGRSGGGGGSGQTGQGNQAGNGQAESDRDEFEGDDPDEMLEGSDSSNQEGPTLREIAREYGLDIDQWMQGEPMSAALTILTATNPVAFTMFQILRNELGLWKGVRGCTDSDEEAVVALCGTAEPGSEEVAECVRAISIANQYVYAGDDLSLLLQNQSAQEQVVEGETIIGSYPLNEGESLEDVANRMGISVGELEALNPGWNSSDGIINVPIPGWTAIEYFVGGQRAVRNNDRTFAQQILPIGTGIDNPGFWSNELLKEWWEGLSVYEKRIEFALTSTAGDSNARFDNIYSFDDSASWIAAHRKEITQAAQDFGIDPIALETMLMAELLYDYESNDQRQDDILRNWQIAADLGRALLPTAWDGAGVGNVHYWTLIDAYN